MFTGIITAVGEVRAARRDERGLELQIAAPYDDLELGESIAVDGACLTVQRMVPGGFEAHVIATSLDRTAFGGYGAGRAVNLERALRMGDRLGGHMVQGHVDGVGLVERAADRDDARLIDIRVPAEVAEVSIPLGSIAVDGVSLTVNGVPAQGVVQISLIPFTLQHTTLGQRRTGDAVHLEGDYLGKHVRNLLAHRSQGL
jgi:riboflavin synthase